MPFLLNTIIDAQSRGAFLALLGTGMVLWYLKPRARAKLFYGFAVLGAVLLVMLGQRFFWERMGTIASSAEADADKDRSVETRLVLIKAQLKMAKLYPLGAGHRGTAVLSPRFIDEYYLSRSGVGGVGTQRSSHNTFMTALVEQGIPGAVLYVWLWSWTVLQLLRFKRDLADRITLQLHGLIVGAGGALAMVGIAGMFVDYIKTEVQIWMFVLLAIGLQFASRELAATVDGSRADAALTLRGQANLATSKAGEPRPTSRRKVISRRGTPG
jgi:O-antigen ligase